MENKVEIHTLFLNRITSFHISRDVKDWSIDHSQTSFAQKSFTKMCRISYGKLTNSPTIQHFQHFFMEITPFLDMHRSTTTVVYVKKFSRFNTLLIQGKKICQKLKIICKLIACTFLVLSLF